jgi:hypothetical protein
VAPNVPAPPSNQHVALASFHLYYYGTLAVYMLTCQIEGLHLGPGDIRGNNTFCTGSGGA